MEKINQNLYINKSFFFFFFEQNIKIIRALEMKFIITLNKESY